MYNHADENDTCPICLGVEGVESSATLIRQNDIVYKDDLVTAFISSFFIGNNPGHVIVVPNKHVENIYDLPTEYGYRVFEIAQKMALALKKIYKAEGITTLQNNEPAGDQHAFHYHFHVFPRYKNDNLHKHMSEKKLSTAKERLFYATKVRNFFENEKQTK